MSKTKAGGKTRQHTTRPGKRLGIKVYSGTKVKPGMIIVRQKGTKVHPGKGVGIGRDHTIFAITSGTVKFTTKLNQKLVQVVPESPLHRQS